MNNKLSILPKYVNCQPNKNPEVSRSPNLLRGKVGQSVRRSWSDRQLKLLSAGVVQSIFASDLKTHLRFSSMDFIWLSIIAILIAKLEFLEAKCGGTSTFRANNLT